MKLQAKDFMIVKQPKGEELSDHYPLLLSLLPAEQQSTNK